MNKKLTKNEEGTNFCYSFRKSKKPDYFVLENFKKLHDSLLLFAANSSKNLSGMINSDNSWIAVQQEIEILNENDKFMLAPATNKKRTILVVVGCMQ